MVPSNPSWRVVAATAAVTVALVVLGGFSSVGAQGVPETSTTAVEPTTTVTNPSSSTTTTVVAVDPDTPVTDDLAPTITDPTAPPLTDVPVASGGGEHAESTADDLLAAAAEPALDPLSVRAGRVPSLLSRSLRSSAALNRRVAAAVDRVRLATAAMTDAQSAEQAAAAVVGREQAALAEVDDERAQAIAASASADADALNRVTAAIITRSAASPIGAMLTGDSLTDGLERAAIVESIAQDAATVARRATQRRRSLDRASARRAATLAAATADHDSAASHLADQTAALDAATRDLNAAQAAAGSAPSAVRGIPDRVLTAYVKAAQWASRALPDCHATWWALAAIGRMESGNASRAALDATGRVEPPIIGIPLPQIGDTDQGRWDQDPTVDHAVGPMQFIPSTWERVGVDATGDGTADPQNIYDAAFSAARYLCAAVGDLRLDTQAGFERAAFSYNHSDEYVQQAWVGSAVYRLAAAA